MFALEIPWELRVKTWVVLLDATRLWDFSRFFQANRRDLVGYSHLHSCPAKAKRRCRAATCKESQPPSNSMMVWSNSHASQLFLSYIVGRWMLTQTSPFSSCPGASGYTIPLYGRNLLFEMNQTAVWFFLFLPCSESLSHWVSSFHFSTLPEDTQIFLLCNPCNKVGMQCRMHLYKLLQFTQKHLI